MSLYSMYQDRKTNFLEGERRARPFKMKMKSTITIFSLFLYTHCEVIRSLTRFTCSFTTKVYST